MGSIPASLERFLMFVKFYTFFSKINFFYLYFKYYLNSFHNEYLVFIKKDAFKMTLINKFFLFLFLENFIVYIFYLFYICYFYWKKFIFETYFFLTISGYIIISKNYVKKLYINLFYFIMILILSYFLILFYIFINYCIHLIPFFFIFTVWFIKGGTVLTLVNGFIYFVKRLFFIKYSNFNDIFWKRAFNLLWLIEGGVFIVFIYLTINASSEINFMLDTQNVLKSRLPSIKIYFYNMLLINLLIVLTYCFSLVLSKTSFEIIFFYFIISTFIIIKILFIEFNQYYYYLNNFFNIIINFWNENVLFTRDLELRRSKVVNNYITICVIAKFWHLFFIVIFWIFTIFSFSSDKIEKHALLNLNLQNFLILFLMNWISVYPCFKYFVRKYLNNHYFWFNYNFKENSLLVFFFTYLNIFYSYVEYYNNILKGLFF